MIFGSRPASETSNILSIYFVYLICSAALLPLAALKIVELATNYLEAQMACLSSICIILRINFKNFPEYTAVSFVSALTFTFTVTSGRTAEVAQH